MPKRAFLSIVILLLALIAHAEAPTHGTATGNVVLSAEGDALRALHEALLRGMAEIHELNLSGNADRDFSMIMIHHCKVAIDLARTQLAHSTDAAVRDQAERVIAVNEQQIVALRKLQADAE